MAVLLGLGAAAGFGVADFFGGISTRRSPVGSVVLVSQGCGLVLAGVLVAIGGSRSTLSVHAAALSVAAGLAGAVGVGFLYRGLGLGRMSLVAPTSALLAAVFPVGWGVVTGERPSFATGIGVALAIVATVTVSRAHGVATSDAEHGERVSPGVSLLHGLAAGVAFGFVLIFFAETGKASGAWPLLLARAASVPVLAVGLGALGRPLMPRRDDVAAVIGSGILDLTGNALFLEAVRRGLTSVVAPVSALYPAFTVLLAWGVSKERATRGQVVGLALALGALVLIGVGA